MSYIRPLSNPEALYAWLDCDGRVYIAEGSKPLLTMPRHVFHGLFERWDRCGYDVKFKGASLSGADEEPFKAKLYYKGWPRSIRAFDVTWEYIAQNVKRRKSDAR